MRKRLLLMLLLSGLLGASGRLWARPLRAQPRDLCPNAGCWWCDVNGDLQACCLYASGSTCSMGDPYHCNGGNCQ